MDNIATLIEGILFASNQPMTAEQIIKVFPEDERPALGEVRKILSDIQEWYGDRGIHLVQVASGFRFQVSQEVAPFIQRTLEEKPQKYSRALLETLALVAYRQPITRAEIEDIRGVAVSTNIMRTLTEQGWVRVIGHKEVPGRPALYATTKGFLDHFGLAHLEELPPLAELKDLNEIDPNLAAAAQDEQAQQDASSGSENDEASEQVTESADASDETVQANSDADSESIDETIEAQAQDTNDDLADDVDDELVQDGDDTEQLVDEEADDLIAEDSQELVDAEADDLIAEAPQETQELVDEEVDDLIAEDPQDTETFEEKTEISSDSDDACSETEFEDDDLNVIS